MVDTVEWMEGHISTRFEFTNALGMDYDYDDDDLQILDHSQEYALLDDMLGVKPREVLSYREKSSRYRHKVGIHKKYYSVRGKENYSNKEE